MSTSSTAPAEPGTLSWSTVSSKAKTSSLPDNLFSAGMGLAKNDVLRIGIMQHATHGPLVGEFHQADKAGNRFRFPLYNLPPDAKRGKKRLATVYYSAPSAQVLEFTPGSTGKGYTLQWQAYAGSVPANALAVSTTTDGRTMYVARAIANSKGVVSDANATLRSGEGYAIGTFIRNRPNAVETGDEPVGEVFIPFSKYYAQPQTFELLVAVPEQLPLVVPETDPTPQERAFFVGVAYAAYNNSKYATYSKAANLSNVTFFGSAYKDGYSLDCTELTAEQLPNSDDFMNLGYVGIGGPASASNQLVVGFRGTLKVAADWSNNFIAGPKAITIGNRTAYAHSGFYYAMQSLLNDMMAQIDVLLQQGDHHTLYLAGHSKGGAMAYLAAMQLRAQYPDLTIQMMTFGSPKPADQTYADLLNVAIPYAYNWIYEADPVPMLPFSDEMVAGIGYLFNVAPSNAGGSTDTPKLQGAKPDIGELALLALMSNVGHLIFYDPDLDVSIPKQPHVWQITLEDVRGLSSLLLTLQRDVEGVTATEPEERISTFMTLIDKAVATSSMLKEVITTLPPYGDEETGEGPSGNVASLLLMSVLAAYVPGFAEFFTKYDAKQGEAYLEFFGLIPAPFKETMLQLTQYLGLVSTHGYARPGTIQYVCGIGDNEQVYRGVSGLLFIGEVIESLTTDKEPIIGAHGYYSDWVNPS